MRLTLVRPEDMMKKTAHTRNAFHFSCWGANVRVATKKERTVDRWGFSIAGNDGENHPFPPAYYETEAVIPRCVPDGDYVLGWVWYGGVESSVKGNGKQEPGINGVFGDYWSCAFVKVRGGELRNEEEKVFVNDMQEYSNEGCMAVSDRPGICAREPCFGKGTFQKPSEFKRGGGVVTMEMYGGKHMDSEDVGKQTKSQDEDWKYACKCIKKGRGCRKELAEASGVCESGVRRKKQNRKCISLCCDECKSRRKGVCSVGQVKMVCGF